MTMMETGGEEPSEEGSQDSTPDSHRRRRLLAAHHKDFIGEDSRKSDVSHGDGEICFQLL